MVSATMWAMSDLHERITDVDELVDFIIYGDIDEMPLSVLGPHWQDMAYYCRCDDEEARVHVAACVKAWSMGKLTKGGWFAYDDTRET